LITEEQLKDAQIKQLGAKKPLQELLVEMGFINEADLLRVTSEIFKMPVFGLQAEAIDASAVKVLPYEVAKRYGVFPVKKKDNTLVVAMSDPKDVVALDDLRSLTGFSIEPVLSAKSDISLNIEKYYQSDEMLYDVLKNVVEHKKADGDEEEDYGLRTGFDVGTLSGQHAPVSKFINLVLSDAVKARASDIHMEPQEKAFKVRYRIDGDLKDIIDVPSKLLSPLVARLKVMSDLDLAETRKAQDGRFSISSRGRKVDIRVSVIPTYYGERIVLRILDPQEAKTELDKLGFRQEELSILKDTCKSAQGMVLVTGPTGSGKTSTLYAALNYLKSSEKNIITIEDPVEYLIGGINQIQVNPIKDVTFATGLRSILRQDPNVILVGEIRDKDTADIAFRASLTGHLVLSTLHTNNAVASITRLLDIGLESYLISSALILIAAQRLLKVNCKDCITEYTPPSELLEKFKSYIEKFEIRKFHRGKGCQKCNFTGFFGRTAIFELLKINEDVRVLIADKAPEETILKEARKSGLRLLAESGIEKVSLGLTTLEEVGKVVDVVREAVSEPVTAPVAAKEEKPPSRARILIVDDEEHILKILEARLKSAGYDCIKAKNGREAVERAVKERPDIIIIDVMMPEMDGFQATKILKSQLETAAIPVMMLTAKKDTESEVKGIELGADDYMSKPFDGARLLARVKMLLRRP